MIRRAKATGKIIDDEVRKLVDGAYKRTKQLLQDKIESVKVIAEELLKKEVLYKDDLERLIGSRPYEDNSQDEDGTIPPPPIGSDSVIGTYPS
jgi:cell division protease FtsH